MIPSTSWICGTTCSVRCPASVASTLTITSYGPLTSSDEETPVMPEILAAAAAALPTSVWISMYA